MKNVVATRKHKEAMLDVANGSSVDQSMANQLKALGWVSITGTPTASGKKIIEAGKAALVESQRRAKSNKGGSLS